MPSKAEGVAVWLYTLSMLQIRAIAHPHIALGPLDTLDQARRETVQYKESNSVSLMPAAFVRFDAAFSVFPLGLFNSPLSLVVPILPEVSPAVPRCPELPLVVPS